MDEILLPVSALSLSSRVAASHSLPSSSSSSPVAACLSLQVSSSLPFRSSTARFLHLSSRSPVEHKDQTQGPHVGKTFSRRSSGCIVRSRSRGGKQLMKKRLYNHTRLRNHLCHHQHQQLEQERRRRRKPSPGGRHGSPVRGRKSREEQRETNTRSSLCYRIP